MKNTTLRGDIAEFQIAAALILNGRRVLRPLNNGLRYDLVIDNEDGTFSRVQCKMGLLRKGCVTFRVYSNDASHRPVTYAGQIDAIAVYCPQNQRSYLVPIGEIQNHRVQATLRVAATANGQLKRTRSAAMFDIGIATARPDVAGSARLSDPPASPQRDETGGAVISGTGSP